MSISLKADPSGTFGEILVNGTPYARVSANGLRTPTDGPYFRRENILGTVSQSGGVPTGAVVERGSNANGEYVRFADGTQICRRNATPSLLNTSNIGFYWQLPSVFVDLPAVSFGISDGDVMVLRIAQPMSYGFSTTHGICSLLNTGGQFVAGDVPYEFRMVAIGRWF